MLSLVQASDGYMYHFREAPGHSGQAIMSMCANLQKKEHVIETLHRVKFKFSGCWKIHISKNWDFTKFNADELERIVAEKQLFPGECGPNTSPIMVLQTCDGSCTPGGFHCAEPLTPPLMYSNKSHTQSENKPAKWHWFLSLGILWYSCG